MDFYNLEPNKTFLVSLKAAIVREGKVLLLHSTADHKYWEFPGGILNMDENFMDGLAREVMEETTLKIHIGDVLGVSDDWRRGFKFRDGSIRDARVVEIMYRCSALSDGIVLSEEHNESKWVTPEDIRTLPMFPEQRGAVSTFLRKL